MHCHAVQQRTGASIYCHTVWQWTDAETISDNCTKGASVHLLNGLVTQAIGSSKESVEATSEVNQGARQHSSRLSHCQSVTLQTCTK